MKIAERKVTAFIGPSGCGKSTLLRCFNRMNDLLDDARVTAGTVKIEGVNINGPEVDVIQCAEGWVWYSRNPIHSQNRSTKTLPTVSGLAASAIQPIQSRPHGQFQFLYRKRNARESNRVSAA